MWIASLVGAAVLLDSIAARDSGAGVVWVVTRGPGGQALNRLLENDDARILNVWGRGTLVQLSVDSMRDTALPPDSTWATLRLSRISFALPGCG